MLTVSSYNQSWSIKEKLVIHRKSSKTSMLERKTTTIPDSQHTSTSSIINYTFALLPHYERVSFACATFIISWLRLRHWFRSSTNVLKCCTCLLVAKPFPESLNTIVARDRPCQPAVPVDGMYLSMVSGGYRSVAVIISDGTVLLVGNLTS